MNSLYWEDALSSSGGQQHDMPVSTHAPSFAVSWGKGKYDDVRPDHSQLTGKTHDDRSYPGGPYVPCRVCGHWADLRSGHNARIPPYEATCNACHRSMNAEERRRMAQDAPMGSNKRSTHIITDTPR